MTANAASAAAAMMKAVQEITGRAAGEIMLTDRLSEDLAIDSLDFVRLVQLAEEGLGCTISDEAAAGARTVGDLVRLGGAAAHEEP